MLEATTSLGGVVFVGVKVIFFAILLGDDAYFAAVSSIYSKKCIRVSQTYKILVWIQSMHTFRTQIFNVSKQNSVVF